MRDVVEAGTRVHKWADSFDAGRAGERVLDTLFAHWYGITAASREEQRQGIDRWFVIKGTSIRKSVEYKTDEVAGRTGNAFVETISVGGGTVNKRGWAYTSQADVLIYRVTGPEAIYIILFSALRQALPEWERKCPAKNVRNVGYVSAGLLVPLDEFERIASRVL